jgi:MFS family permease
MIGNLYLWGNICQYVTSYYKINQEDPNASNSKAILILPLSFTVQACFNPVGAYLQKKMNPKILMLIGSAVCISSLYLASLMTSWIWFVFFYAVCFPIGVGLSYWTPILCGYEWYPKRKGMVSGIIIGAFGFGAFIFGFLTKEIVNPDN